MPVTEPRGPMDPTPPLDEFLVAYEADDNEWWRAASGDHQNWFEEAVDRWRAAEAEVERLRAALAARPQRLGYLLSAVDDVLAAADEPTEMPYLLARLRTAREAVAGSATPTECHECDGRGNTWEFSRDGYMTCDWCGGSGEEPVAASATSDRDDHG